MKKHLIYTSLLSISLSVAANFAQAQTPPNPPPSSRIENASTANLRAEENVLYHVAKARIDMTNQHNDMATKELDLAISELANVPADSKMQIQVISFDYGKKLITKSISIPIIGNKTTLESIKNNMQGIVEGDNNITNAKVEYISFNTKKKDIEKDLVEAKKAVDNNKTTIADFNLVQWRTRIIDKINKNIPYLEKTGANIVLARVMLQQKNYDSARSAVDEAKDALKNYLDTVQDAEQKKQFGLIEDDLKNISKEIDRKDPSLIEKIDNTLDKWWKKVTA
jgi:hypothetical protein